jgi:hypothetical protein
VFIQALLGRPLLQFKGTTMNTITWIIEAMDCKPQEGDLTDVVITAHWRCNGTDGTYSGTVYGTCSFNQPGEPFTPYSSLTQEQVLGWVWADGVDKFETEANVVNQIDAQVNPTVISPPLPWSQA